MTRGPLIFTKIIKPALNQLIAEDNFLLFHDSSERSITHKLAEKIQLLYPEYTVDCEYNRQTLSGGKVVAKQIKPTVFFEQMHEQMHEQIKNVIYALKHQQPKISDSSDNIDENNDKQPYSDLLKALGSLQNDFDKINDGDSKDYDTLTQTDRDLIKFGIYLLRNGDTLLEPKTIYPDIIAHHRGTKDNMFVIESKKSKNKEEKARAYDLLKLGTLTNKPYNYRYAFFLDLPVTDDFTTFREFTCKRVFDGSVKFFNKVWEVKFNSQRNNSSTAHNRHNCCYRH